jgi:hypothetical protein
MGEEKGVMVGERYRFRDGNGLMRVWQSDRLWMVSCEGCKRKEKTGSVTDGDSYITLAMREKKEKN